VILIEKEFLKNSEGNLNIIILLKVKTVRLLIIIMLNLRQFLAIVTQKKKFQLLSLANESKTRLPQKSKLKRNRKLNPLLLITKDQNDNELNY
jgi:hypothetical protein